MNVQYHIEPGGTLRGKVRVPGDKSISHRSIMLGSIADGVTEVKGFLAGEDCLATISAFRNMGVHIDGPTQEGRVIVHGVGAYGLHSPSAPLDLGNSGTSIRLLTGLLAAQAFGTVVRGDASLMSRPMRRVTDPLSSMGAFIETSPTGTPPLRIKGVQQLQGVRYVMPIASAQVKSALLLAGIYATGRTCVVEPSVTRDHTERMLIGFGYRVWRQDLTVCLEGKGHLQGIGIDIPADISSAAFFMVGAAIAKGSDLILEHVGINPTRTGIINILKKMGADIEIMNEHTMGGEPVADIHVRALPLHGIRIPHEQVPLAIDEFPALFVAAACAEGETVLTGAGELRVKECDRIKVMAEGLTALGISVVPTADGMVIQGGRLHGGHVHSQGDHRVAMAFAIAALRADGMVKVDDCANVRTSFPGFVSLAQKAGLRIKDFSLP